MPVDNEAETRPAIRVVVHPYATALPLGCFAFGIGNTLLSIFALHWLPPSDTPTLAVIMLAFVAPLELIPCIMAFLSRDTGAATAMGIFSAGWVVQGIQLMMAGQGATSPVTGIFFLLLSLCLGILAVGTFSGKPLIGSLFCVALLRSASAALIQFGITGGVDVINAVFGFALAFLAFYCGLGLLLEDVYQKPLPMMFRRGKAEAAMVNPLDRQLERVATEAGVRAAIMKKVVVVTGASAGVGRAVVREFAKAGAHIGLVARGVERLESAKREVEQLGGRALVIPTDVADADAVEEAAALTEREFGPIDIWVNDAMTTVFAPFLEIAPEEFKRATEVTYLGYVYGTLAALKRMKPRDRGTIVQVGSALAYRSIPLQSAYCGAKHAMVGFTDSIRSELIHDGSAVYITAVHLPAMNTPQFSWCRTRLPIIRNQFRRSMRRRWRRARSYGPRDRDDGKCTSDFRPCKRFMDRRSLRVTRMAIWLVMLMRASRLGIQYRRTVLITCLRRFPAITRRREYSARRPERKARRVGSVCDANRWRLLPAS